MKHFRLGDTYGGVNRQLAPHVLPNNVASKTENWVVRTKGLVTANGWEKFTDQILTDGAASPVNLSIYWIDQYYKDDGTVELVAFTNKRVYRFDEANDDLWVPITPGTDSATTVDQDSASGATTLYVASTTGYAAGDTIIIHEGGAREEEAVIDSISAGVSFTLLANLTYTHTAAQADPVRRTYAASIVDSDSASGQKVLNVSHTGQYTAGEAIVIGLGDSDVELNTIDTIQAGVSLTLDNNLTNTHTAAAAHKVYRLAELTLGSAASNYDADNTRNTYYFTDGANAIQTWDGSGTPTYTSNLAGVENGDDIVDVTLSADLLAKYIRAFEGFLVVAYLTENGTAIPQKIRWSQYDDFTKWDNESDGTGQAGWFLFESPDWIMGLHQLKRELLIYRERSIEAMSYIGPPDVFGFRRAETGTGLVAPRAIVDFGDHHLFVGPDNVWEYNGISLVPIGDPIKDELFDVIDPSQLSNITCFFMEEKDEVWISYSTTGSRVHDQAYVYNTLFKKWSGPRDIDATGYGYYNRQATTTWDNWSGTWDGGSAASWDSRAFLANAPLNLMGNDDGLIFEVDEIATKDGSTISKRYESKLTDCGMPGITKRLQRVKIDMEEPGAATLEVYVGTATSAGDEIAWNGPETVTIGADQDPYIYFDLSAKYFKVRVDTDDSANIRDVEVHFYPRGHR
jgi:hypothetical protein